MIFLLHCIYQSQMAKYKQDPDGYSFNVTSTKSGSSKGTMVTGWCSVHRMNYTSRYYCFKLAKEQNRFMAIVQKCSKAVNML